MYKEKYCLGVAGTIGRTLLITLSFLLFGVFIMLSFTMYYFKKHKVGILARPSHLSSRPLFQSKIELTFDHLNFQSAKATLSDAELKLFIHGDQKSIDFSAPPSLLSEQVSCH